MRRLAHLINATTPARLTLNAGNAKAVAACSAAAFIVLGCTGCQDETERQTTGSYNESAEGAYATPVADVRDRDDQPTAVGTERASQEEDNDDGLIFPGVGGNQAIRLTRSSPTQVRVGEPFEYQLEISNISEVPAHSIVVHETLPEGMRIRSQNGDRTQQNGLATGSESHRVGSLMPGESRIITVQGVAESQGQADICVAVDFNQTLCTTLNVVEPQIRLTRAVSDQPMYICDDIEVSYVLTNTGTGETRDAVIIEDLPEGYTYEGSSQVQLQAGTLSAGESFEETIIVNANRPGQFNSYAIARAGELAVESDQQHLQILRPELDIRIEGPQNHYVGWPASYRVIVQNISDDPALDTVVELPILAELSRSSIGPGDLERNGNTVMLGRLDPGQSRSIDLSFVMETPTDRSMTAVAEAYCTRSVQDHMVTIFEGIPALRLELIDLTDPVPVGENTIYQVRVKNQGTAEDINVRLVGDLPPELEFVSGTGDSGVRADGRQIIFEPIDRLSPEDTVSWRVEVRALEAGDVRFTINLESDATERSISAEEPTNLFQP